MRLFISPFVTAFSSGFVFSSAASAVSPPAYQIKQTLDTSYPTSLSPLSLSTPSFTKNSSSTYFRLPRFLHFRLYLSPSPPSPETLLRHRYLLLPRLRRRSQCRVELEFSRIKQTPATSYSASFPLLLLSISSFPRNSFSDTATSSICVSATAVGALLTSPTASTKHPLPPTLLRFRLYLSPSPPSPETLLLRHRYLHRLHLRCRCQCRMELVFSCVNQTPSTSYPASLPTHHFHFHFYLSLPPPSHEPPPAPPPPLPPPPASPPPLSVLC